VEKYKGGSRVSYVAGERAFKYLDDMEDAISKLKSELGVNLDELPFRVRQIQEERDEYKKAALALTEELASALAANYEEDTVVQEVEYEDELMKYLTTENLLVTNNDLELKELVCNLINQDPTAKERFKKNPNISMHFVGQIMKLKKGSVDPKTVKDIVEELISK